MGDYDTENDANALVVCPFNIYHRVSRKRLLAHITKCKNEHPEFRACPFNALHYVLEEEYPYHLEHCTERAPVDRHLVTNCQESAECEVPPYMEHNFSERAPEEMEYWDDPELETETRKYEQKKREILNPQGLQPAQRRMMYQKAAQKMKDKKESELPEPALPLAGGGKTNTAAGVSRGRGGAGSKEGGERPSRIGAVFSNPPALSRPTSGLQRSSLIQETSLGRGRGALFQTADMALLTSSLQQSLKLNCSSPPSQDLSPDKSPDAQDL